MRHWPLSIPPETATCKTAHHRCRYLRLFLLPQNQRCQTNSQTLRSALSNFSLVPRSAGQWRRSMHPCGLSGCKSARSVGQAPLCTLLGWIAAPVFQVKPHRTNFKRALVLGQFAQPSPLPSPYPYPSPVAPPSRKSRKNMNAFPLSSPSSPPHPTFDAGPWESMIKAGEPNAAKERQRLL
jgi:hypothetical protein